MESSWVRHHAKNLTLLLALACSPASFASAPKPSSLNAACVRANLPDLGSPTPRRQPAEDRWLETEQGSIAFRHPETLRHARAVDAPLPDPDALAASLERSLGRPPTVAEVRELMILEAKRRADELVAASLRHPDPRARLIYQGAAERLRAQPAEALQNDLRLRPDDLGRSYVPGDPSCAQAFDAFGRMLGGLAGEMESALRLKGVVGFSVHFSDMSQNQVTERIKRVFQGLDHKVAAGALDLHKLKLDYPSIFSRIDPTQDLRQELARVRAQWLERKEIDLIRVEADKSRPGAKKTVWSEVKRLREPLTVEDLMNHGERNILSQLASQLQIRDFLGLKGEVDVELVLVNGIRPGAKELLEDLGYRVTGRVVE